jgi:hypothetical protein
MSFWEVIWFIVITFAFGAYLMVLFSILTDLFRDHALNGWLKALDQRVVLPPQLQRSPGRKPKHQEQHAAHDGEEPTRSGRRPGRHQDQPDGEENRGNNHRLGHLPPKSRPTSPRDGTQYATQTLRNQAPRLVRGGMVEPFPLGTTEHGKNVTGRPGRRRNGLIT